MDGSQAVVTAKELFGAHGTTIDLHEGQCSKKCREVEQFEDGTCNMFGTASEFHRNVLTEHFTMMQQFSAT
jgi:hypothetical protein